MANGPSAVRWLQIGTSTGVITGPSNYVFTDPQGEIEHSCVQERIDIKTRTDDGEETAPQLGVKKGSLSYSVLLRGLGTAAEGAAAVAPSDIQYALDTIMGFVGQAGTGITSGSSHSTTVINVSSTSGLYDGASSTQVATGVCMLNTSATWGAVYQFREIESLGTSPVSFTVDRAFDAAPANSAKVWTGTSWYYDQDLPTRSLYTWFKLEGPDWARTISGCAGSFKITQGQNGVVLLTFNWLANDWSDLAEENPTWTSTGQGTASGIVMAGSPFWLDSSQTQLIQGEFDLNATPQPRTATVGANGQHGWIYPPAQPTFTGTIYHSDATWTAMQTATTIDVAWQIGTQLSSATAGNGAYLRIPALAITGEPKIVKHNGQDAIQFTGKATRPAAANGKGSVRLHLFGKAAA